MKNNIFETNNDRKEIACISSTYNELGKEEKIDFLNVMQIWLNGEIEKLNITGLN